MLSVVFFSVGTFKAIKIRTYEEPSSIWPNLTCQKISTDGVSEIIDSGNHKITTLIAGLYLNPYPY